MKQALIALFCCGQYIWLLVCRDMANWPLFLRSEWLYNDVLGADCTDSCRGRAFGTNRGCMAIVCPTRVVRKKTRENTIELRFWPSKRTKSEFQRFFSVPNTRWRGDYSGTASISWLVDHYASESNTHCFGLISGFFPQLVISLESCQS